MFAVARASARASERAALVVDNVDINYKLQLQLQLNTGMRGKKWHFTARASPCARVCSN